MKAAVVILNWNGKKFLEQFLPSVTRNSPSWARIIVADNASGDDSVDFMRNQYPQVDLIINAKNHGFAGGYNVALQQVQEEFLVLLNSDVEVTEGWLEPLIAWLEADPKRVAVQPKIRAFHDRESFEYAGAAGGYMDKDYYSFCRGRLFDELEKDHGQYNDNREVAWATGACLVIRKSAFDRAGGFDTDFFAHMEEIDLCLRLKNMGLAVGYCSEGVVYHVGGGTLNKVSPFKTYLNYRNNLYLITKNHFTGPLFTKLFFRLVLDGVSAGPMLLKGEFGNITAILKAHFHFYAALPALLRKRKTIRSQRNQPNTAGLYPGSVIWQYFVKGKKKFSDYSITT
ncbi:MAG: glycosyltransferase family 2 protein [Bacteroidota bacterium]